MAAYKMFVGDTLPAMAFVIEGDDGNPVDISGATFVGVTNPVRFENVHDGSVFYGAGTPAVVTPADGLISYTCAAADTVAAHEGDWRIVITIDLDGAGNEATFEPFDESVTLLIKPKPTT